jgi:hypothetical protein
VELTFGDEDLAETCNHRQLMAAAWGEQGFECVARRLLELAAARGTDEIALLPNVSLERSPRDGVRIDFADGETVIRGVLSTPNGAGATVRLQIDGLTVNMDSVPS